MKTVILGKADPSIRNEPIRNVTIVINGKLPVHNLKGAERYFDEQARMLADALFNSLPQGTTDRLLIRLMQRKLSLYHG